MCVYKSDCVEIIYELPLLPNNTSETFLQIGSDAKGRLDIYQWGAGLSVTWQIRDTGRTVLQSSF